MTIAEFSPEEVAWCETCRPHVNGHCDGCGLEFDPTDMQYQSQSFHYHPRSVAGTPGTVSVQKGLCVDCYRKDHAAVYPNHPVPPLPDRGMDPAFFALQQIAKARNAMFDIIDSGSVRPLTADEAQRLRAMVKEAIK